MSCLIWNINYSSVNQKLNLRSCRRKSSSNRPSCCVVSEYSDVFEEEIGGMEGKVFSKVDLREGFLQAELHEESIKLTVFQTLRGCYRWHRILLGITPAPEIF